MDRYQKEIWKMREMLGAAGAPLGWLDFTTRRCQRSTQQCNTVKHSETKWNTVQHSTTQCNTVQHSATQFNTVQHIATQCKLRLQSSPVPLGVVRQSAHKHHHRHIAQLLLLQGVLKNAQVAFLWSGHTNYDDKVGLVCCTEPEQQCSSGCSLHIGPPLRFLPLRLLACN